MEESPSEEPESTATNQPKEEEPKADAEVSKPKGFTPRFKAGVTKTNANQENKESQSEESSNKEEDNSNDTLPKPLGFKPRFTGRKPSGQNDNEE